MWSRTLDREVGDRIHRLIGELVMSGSGLTDVMPYARKLLSAYPVSGARANSVRMQVASAAGTYLRRYRPDAELIGIELPVGDGVADLVWMHDGLVVIDEVKSGVCDVTDSVLLAQVERFILGGRTKWGTAFLGVRLVPLARPRTCTLITDVVGGHLMAASTLPVWLEVR